MYVRVPNEFMPSSYCQWLNLILISFHIQKFGINQITKITIIVRGTVGSDPVALRAGCWAGVAYVAAAVPSVHRLPPHLEQSIHAAAVNVACPNGNGIHNGTGRRARNRHITAVVAVSLPPLSPEAPLTAIRSSAGAPTSLPVSLSSSHTSPNPHEEREREGRGKDGTTGRDGVAGGVLVRGGVARGGGAPVGVGRAAGARRPGARRGGGRGARGAPTHQGLRQAPPQARRRGRAARRHAPRRGGGGAHHRGRGGRSPRAAQPRRQGREVRTYREAAPHLIRLTRFRLAALGESALLNFSKV